MASRTAGAMAKRTVHVKIYPTARTFAERREVLRVLEQFGEVEMFRSLKYHPRTPVPNAFYTLFNGEAAAEAALNQSPIRYKLMAEPSSPPSSQAEPSNDRVFELHISTTNFDHQRYLTSPITNPLYGPYKPVSPNRSYIAASLDDVIAPSIAAPGLKDWETDGLQMSERRTQDLGAGPGLWQISPEWRVAQRERRRREKAIPAVMKGLRALRRECEEQNRQSLGTG